MPSIFFLWLGNVFKKKKNSCIFLFPAHFILKYKKFVLDNRFDYLAFDIDTMTYSEFYNSKKAFLAYEFLKTWDTCRIKVTRSTAYT